MPLALNLHAILDSRIVPGMKYFSVLIMCSVHALSIVGFKPWSHSDRVHSLLLGVGDFGNGSCSGDPSSVVDGGVICVWVVGVSVVISSTVQVVGDDGGGSSSHVTDLTVVFVFTVKNVFGRPFFIM